MTSLKTRISEDNVTIKSVGMADPPWATFLANWWKVTLTRKGRTLTTLFGLGPAIKGQPTAEQVLECLLSDTASYENAEDIYDWARDYGMDPDLPVTRRTYQRVGVQKRQLRRFLAEDYDAYLWETEED